MTMNECINRLRDRSKLNQSHPRVFGKKLESNHMSMRRENGQNLFFGGAGRDHGEMKDGTGWADAALGFDGLFGKAMEGAASIVLG